MKSSDSSFCYQLPSPQASTEEKSLQDNIDINKLSLEKGLKNRPNQYVLVDRGILLNPGKAHSDKMHQLDLAKKRDKLKKKIENRPERDELIRKLIIQEENDCRQTEIDRIKYLLDCNLNTRPGTLELVDKNILQVDRFLASRVHNGDITYPKVCTEDTAFDYNSTAPLPPISEVDLLSSLNDLSDILSQSSSKSSANKAAQNSYKKTYRVGRYSFHNIEFRPTAQKAREYQQNELLEYEKIQAQHDPSLKKVHSELALKSRHINDSRADKYRALKGSLLNRLNVHELKSECKLRLISCSNIPKVQLVEKLLPYEAEVLKSHSSSDQNRSMSINYNRSERRTNSMYQPASDFSPPDLTTQTNHTPPPYAPTIDRQLQQPNQSQPPLFDGRSLMKISHSISEPIILDQNYVSPMQFNFVNSANNFHYNHPNFDRFNPNNSYPLLNTDSIHSQMKCSSQLAPMEYYQPPVKPENLVYNTQSPSVSWNSNNFNGFASENGSIVGTNSQQSMSFQENYFNDIPAVASPSLMTPWSNRTLLPFPLEVKVPLVPNGCEEKFELISNQTVLLKHAVDKINNLKVSNQINPILHAAFDEYKIVRDHLINLTKDMIEFIRIEVKFRRIDQSSASKQTTWLTDLLNLINNGFNSVKYEIGTYNGTELIPTNNSVSTSNGESLFPNNNLEDLDIIEFLNTEPNKPPSPPVNDNQFLKVESFDYIWDKHDPFNCNDLKTPETQFSEICASPMSIDDVDQIMNCLLHSSNDHFM